MYAALKAVGGFEHVPSGVGRPRRRTEIPRPRGGGGGGAAKVK
jgi:hypothetical protein